MNTYYLKNVHNGELLTIKAYSWEIQSYQHTFIGNDTHDSLIFSSYSTKNWDVIDVKLGNRFKEKTK